MRHVVRRRWRNAVAESGGLDLGAVGGGSALFDDGVQLSDCFVDICVGSSETAWPCGCSVGSVAGR